MKDKRSLTLIELLIVLSVIFVLIGTFAIYVKMTLRIAREEALRMELGSIRTSIEHYRVINGEFPENLVTLLNQEFTFKTLDGITEESNFLKPFRIDEQNNLKDPFLNRYSYDNEHGRVKSQSKGYESW